VIVPVDEARGHLGSKQGRGPMGKLKPNLNDFSSCNISAAREEGEGMVLALNSNQNLSKKKAEGNNHITNA